MIQNQHTCSKCGKKKETDKLFTIDKEPVCSECIYGDLKPFEVYPIGFVHNKQQRGDGFGLKGKTEVSRIELLPSQKPFMHKLEEEEYLMIIYYLHRSENVRSVFNRGLDKKEVGVFASRTPDRLSGIAVKTVKLVKVEDTTLFVKDLDAIDGSPVLDIKMQVKGY